MEEQIQVEGKMGSLKRACADLKQKILYRADKIADICIDKSVDPNESKVHKIKEETVALFKSIAGQSKKRLEKVNIRDMFFDATFGAGKVARVTRAKGAQIVHSTANMKNLFNKKSAHKDDYCELGKHFFQWNKEGKLKLLHNNAKLESQLLEIKELIEYVKDKKSILSK